MAAEENSSDAKKQAAATSAFAAVADKYASGYFGMGSSTESADAADADIKFAKLTSSMTSTEATKALNSASLTTIPADEADYYGIARGSVTTGEGDEATTIYFTIVLVG